ncbi:hypothetical protein [Methanolobus bombayensis]|uniref:hypothetical protein n=1 Tax=Methanolobus bombayensis TaxID=38023 RepID=UPI001AE94142|nr:hypothetical protein [Methanolobus bombayensis]MBP1909183.1 hypothetical protein [Methanolobus bombayensis]
MDAENKRACLKIIQKRGSNMIESVDVDISDFIDDGDIISETVYNIDINIEIDWDTVAEKVLDMYTGGFDIDEIVHRVRTNENKYLKASQDF